MNLAALTGRLTRDPEIRYLESGESVTSFSIAVNSTRDEADFFDCEAWGKTGQILADYARKGHLIGLQGRLKIDKWTDRETGAKRSKIKVVVDRVDLLTPKGEAEKMRGSAPSPAQRAADPPGYDPDDEVPF